MKYNSGKIKKILFSFVLLNEFRHSFQITQGRFAQIVQNHSEIVNCFNNEPNQCDDEVQRYLIKIKKSTELDTECAKNIIAVVGIMNNIINTRISNDKSTIAYLNFDGGSVDKNIFKVIPPTTLYGINLSNNHKLRGEILTIPDEFIKHFEGCPFTYKEQENGVNLIKVGGCSTDLINKCKDNISCVAAPAKPKELPSYTTPPSGNEKKDPNPTNDPGNNDSSDDKKTKPVITPSDDGSNESSNQKSSNSKVNTKVVPVSDNSEEADTKSLLETFLFGLLTSVGVLGFVFLVLCMIQTYTKKRILNFKRTSYEDKPLVKSNSSSMNDSVSNFGTHSNSSNYNPSNSSQTSYNTKHKRYLYVFDDGSIMMSKSHQTNRSNPASSITSPVLTNLGTNSSTNANNTIPKYTNNENNINSSNANLSITISPNNSYNTTLSPLIGSPAIGSPIKSYNKNIVNISVPNNYVTEMNNRLDERISNRPYSTNTK